MMASTRSAQCRNSNSGSTGTCSATLRQRDDDAALPRWVLHDLRRTIRTNLSALDVPDTVAEAVIGHGRKGIQRVYDRWRYLPQIRDALEAWQARLAILR